MGLRGDMLALCVLLSLWAVHDASCPACATLSYQQKACNAHFLLKTKVTGNLTSNRGDDAPFAFYKIRKPQDHNVFKMNGFDFDTLGRKNSRRMYTFPDEDSCGVTNLEVQKSYLFSGFYDAGKNRMSINLCGSWVVEAPLPISRNNLRKFANETYCADFV